MIAGARAKAIDMKLNVNMATVDDGGHLVAFRANGRGAAGEPVYRDHQGDLCRDFSPADRAAPGRRHTGRPGFEFELAKRRPDERGKITALLGGVPVVVDGQVIGAVGIAGGTGEKDAQVARAGVQAFADQLARSEQAAKTPEKPE